LNYAKRRTDNALIDPRITRVLSLLSTQNEALGPLPALAAQVGLSTSRFQHLFTQQVGVPFRRYRSWQRMRLAIREIIKGQNFTTAAHAAGFTDSAHFSNDFRNTFGAAPSISLKKLARLQP